MFVEELPFSVSIHAESVAEIMFYIIHFSNGSYVHISSVITTLITVIHKESPRDETFLEHSRFCSIGVCNTGRLSGTWDTKTSCITT